MGGSFLIVLVAVWVGVFALFAWNRKGSSGSGPSSDTWYQSQCAAVLQTFAGVRREAAVEFVCTFGSKISTYRTGPYGQRPAFDAIVPVCWDILEHRKEILRSPDGFLHLNTAMVFAFAHTVAYPQSGVSADFRVLMEQVFAETENHPLVREIESSRGKVESAHTAKQATDPEMPESVR